MKTWETLFLHALSIIDAAVAAGATQGDWSFGGGTVLMRRHRHRISKDVDIFVPDPQWLGYLTPRLNARAESLAPNYLEQAGFLKLYFDEGEIDFVASAPLTQAPTVVETLFDRHVRVETSSEIIAKKVWHRGAQFTARDIFDLALVIEKEPEALMPIRPILENRRDVVLKRITTQDPALREAFGALDVLEFRRSYDECVGLVNMALG
jgi:hypothetical protein